MSRPTSSAQSTEVLEEAVHPAAKVIARALRHRQEQIEKGCMGDRQTETPNQIAEEVLADAAPLLLKQGAEEERERWLGLRRAVEEAIEKMRGDQRNQEPLAVADVLERALPGWGCARDSEWCDGQVCRDQGVKCPNQETS